MKYKYDVIDKFRGDGIIVKAPQLIDLIKRDVKNGKWNIYNGGKAGKTHAKLSYKGKNWEYHEHLLIDGSPREIQFIESKIRKFIKVIPRQFKEKQ